MDKEHNEEHTSIPLRPEDLDDLRVRTASITHYTHKAEEHAREAARCRSTALYLQESLTLWLGQQYDLDLDTEQWHLDLPNKALIRQS